MTTVCWDGNTLAADTLFVAGNRKMAGGYEKILLPEDRVWTVEGHPILVVGFSGAVACMDKVRKLLETNIVIGTDPGVNGDSFSLIMITDKKVNYYWNTGTTAVNELVNELFIVEGNHAVGSGTPYAMGVMAIKGDAISGVKGAIKVDLHSGGYIDAWSFDTPRALTRINPVTGEIISSRQLLPVPEKKDAILCASGG